MGKWTRERIVREILARHAAGLGLSCTGGQNGTARALYQAAGRMFGSWKIAVAAAGFSAAEAKATREWSPKKVIAAIRSLARRRSPLNAAEVLQRYGRLVPTARRYFGSWPKAIRAARVDPRKLSRAPTWTKESVLECILLKMMRSEPLQRHLVEPQALAEAGARLFGTWREALGAAGLDADKITVSQAPYAAAIAAGLREASLDELSALQHRYRTPWSEREILAAVILRSRRGEAMNGTAVHREQRTLYHAATERYGDWKSVLAVAGIVLPADL